MSSTTQSSDGNAQRRFRDALALFPTGVAVVTAPRPGGMPIGITIASFNSVSLDPPLILFSIDRRCLSLADLCAAPSFAVNVLDEDQQTLSNRFATSGAPKWEASELTRGDTPVLLPAALATFECEPYAQHDGGDHVIFIGRVTRYSARPDGRPLVFFGGRYRALAVAPASAT